MNWKTLALLGAAAAGVAALLFGRRQTVSRRRVVELPERTATSRAASPHRPAAGSPSPAPAATTAGPAGTVPGPAESSPAAGEVPAPPVLDTAGATAEFAEMLAEDAFLEAVEPVDTARAASAMADAMAAVQAASTGRDADSVTPAPDEGTVVPGATSVTTARERVDSDITIMAGGDAAATAATRIARESTPPAPGPVPALDEESAQRWAGEGGAPPEDEPVAPPAVDPLAATVPGAVLPAMERQLAHELLVAAGDDGAALQAAATAVSAPGERSAGSYLEEGNVYFNVGQYALAIDRYSRALEVDGSLAAAYYNRANARTRSGEYEAALADYGRALALQPNDADALNNRGMLHVYRGDYAAAVADFDAALAIAPGDTTVLVNRGLARLHAGQAVEALADFATATGRDPRDAAAHYGTGQASAVLGDNDAALAALRRAIEIDPEYAREAAADPKLTSLDGNPEFLKLLRDAGARPAGGG